MYALFKERKLILIVLWIWSDGSLANTIVSETNQLNKLSFDTLHNNLSSYSIYFFFSSLILRPLRLGATGGGILEPCPPNETCDSPKRGLCPKESNKLGVTEVQLEAWGPQDTDYHPKISVQELFFRRFCNVEPFFCGFTPELVEIRTFSEMKIFFFCFLVFTPELVEMRAFFEMNTFFLFGFHPRIRGNSRIFSDEDLFYFFIGLYHKIRWISRWTPLFFGPHHRRCQDFWLGGPKPQITCNDVIRSFQKRNFL